MNHQPTTCPYCGQTHPEGFRYIGIGGGFSLLICRICRKKFRLAEGHGGDE
jgi:transposase-like protein